MAKTIPEVHQRKREVVPVTVTVAVYADHWLCLIASTVKPRTLVSYASTLRLHLLPAFGTWRAPASGSAKRLRFSGRISMASRENFV